MAKTTTKISDLIADDKNFNKEVWKDFIGFENDYEISNYGRIKSKVRKKLNGRYFTISKEKIMSTPINKFGYKRFCIIRNKVNNNSSVHRLVAKHFIVNHENKPQVNHINGIKTDNHVNNLEWCTVRENNIHAIKTGLNKGHTKKVINKETNFVFDTLKHAAKIAGYNYSHFCEMLNGKVTNNSKFIYLNE